MPKNSSLLKKILKLRIYKYIQELLADEEYSFSLKEIIETTDKSEASVKSELSRLVEKKEIVNLRKGFYLILTPRYARSEKLPIQLYCEKLFKYLNRKYYLGLYTAAKIHGASHQQIQGDYMLVNKTKFGNIKKQNFDIRFFTSTCWPSKNIQPKKSDAGIYYLSSPALTLVDLIRHQTKIGGINRMLATIEELSEELEEGDLIDLLSWYPYKSTLQRLGFLLDELTDTNSLAEILYEYLISIKYYPVLLSPKTSQKPGAAGNKWKVDINIKLEHDL